MIGTVTPQHFLGDTLELQMEAAGKPAFDSTELALDAYYDGAYSAADFLLSLYDSGRVPFVKTVPRAAFVNFFRQAVANFQVTGTFEAYLLVIRAVFGSSSLVLFTIPAPGKVTIQISAANSILTQWSAIQVVAGTYQSTDFVTKAGDAIQFVSFAGISTDTDLKALFTELVPAGIFPNITLQFFTIGTAVAADSIGATSFLVDHLGNQLIYINLGA